MAYLCSYIKHLVQDTEAKRMNKHRLSSHKGNAGENEAQILRMKQMCGEPHLENNY